MFDVLLASGAHRDIKLRWFTTSALSHGLLLALAIGATRSAMEAARTAVPNDEILLFIPRAPEAPPPIRAEKPAIIVNLGDPPPQGFQTVPPLSEIPSVIPPVDLNQRPFDPRDFTGRGMEGGVADGVVGGTGPGPVDQDATRQPRTSPASSLPWCCPSQRPSTPLGWPR